MAVALIETIRAGQRALSAQLILEQGVQRGLLSAQQIETLDPITAGEDLVPRLVSDGYLSQVQLETLIEDVEITSIMDTVTDAEAPEEVSAAASEPGRRVGKYTLVNQVGAGGMGVVWRAWDQQLTRWVALKQLKLNDPRLISRFMREASLLARLSHPNITAVYEIGVHQGEPFLVMELVDGSSPGGEALARIVAAAMVRDAARAVQYAHERNIVHRDLKPSNLLVNSEGRVFVTDFGLARLREGNNDLTASGALLGTPSFMAPEQAQGKEADHRTDVYGLGATLYALVAGEPPYSGEIVHEVVKRVAVSNPPTLAGDDDLTVIAQKAMERDRQDRYQSAAELAEELQRYIDDEPILARPLTPLQRGWRRARRRPALSLAVATGVLLFSIVSVWGGMRLDEYYTRQSEIEAATVHVANAQGQEQELRKIYNSDVLDLEAEAGTLENIHRFASLALEQAPGYAPAEYLRGLAYLWQDEYDLAHQHFTAALADDPLLEEARVYRMVSEFARAEVASPEIVHDRNGLRVIAARDSADKDSVVQALQADLSLLDPASTRINLARAIVSSVQGDFSAATDALHQHLSVFLSDQRIRSMLALTLIGAQRYDEAMAAANKLIERGKYPADGYEALAFAEAAAGNIERAHATMQKAVARAADDSRLQWLASWKFQLGEFAAAFETFGEILKRNPDHLGALLGRAGAIAQIISGPGDPLEQTGLADARRAVQLAPDNAYANFVLGQAALYSEPAAAIKAHERAIELDPEEYSGHSRAMIAAAYFHAGDTESAAANMRKALQVEPGQLSWQMNLARFEIASGQLDQAAVTLSGVDDNEALELLLTVHGMQGNHTQALQLAQSLSEAAPENVNYKLAGAEHAAALGDYAGATQSLAAVQQRGGLNPDQLIRVADTLRLLGQPTQALRVAAEAIAADPGYMYYQTVAAMILIASDQVSVAEQHLPILTAQPPDFAGRAELWCFLGQGSKARASLSQLEHQPAQLAGLLNDLCP